MIDNRENKLKNDIDSHSSALTNQRIFNIKELIWQAGHSALSGSVNPMAALNYFSAITMFYMELPNILEEPINKPLKEKIEPLISRGILLQRTLRTSRNPTTEQVYALIDISMMLQYLLNIAMQNLRYYFRTVRQEVKGLDAAIELFDTSSIWKGRKKNIEVQDGEEDTSLL